MGQTHRTTEGVLLLFASLILILGFVLVFLAKAPEFRQQNTANINTAGEDQIASALGIDRAVARRVCEYRNAHGDFPNTSALSEVRLLSPEEVEKLAGPASQSGVDIATLSPGELAGRFGIGRAAAAEVVKYLASRTTDGPVTVRELLRIPAVQPETVNAHDGALRVRDPSPALVSFWLHIGLLIIGFFLLHALLQRAAPVADPFLLPGVMLLAGIGAIILFSLKHPLRDTDVYGAQINGILLGLMAAAIPLTRKFRSLHPWRYTYIYALFAVSLTFLLAAFGTGPGGTRLRLLGMQPVEIVKIALVFFVASYLADRWSVLIDRTGPRRRPLLPLFRDIGPLLVMYLTSLATFVLLKDQGPMLVLFGMFAALLCAATGRFSFVSLGLGLVAVSGWIAYHLHLGVFDVRVDMWLHPWENMHANGMHLAQALWGLGSGGLWGSGLGLGGTRYMPRSGSDLIFASIGEELGLIGSLAVLVLYSIIIIRGIRIALHARTDFERFLASGITLLLGIQTVVIVFGVLGLLPLTGITLPFASFGRSSVIASFFALGLLLNISSSGGRTDVPDVTRRALRALSIGLVVLLLGVAGIGRLMLIQGIHADRIAGNTVIVPDADGISRAHINPRLKAIEASIPRGSICDRNGRVLATSRPAELAQLGVQAEAASRPGDRFYPCDGTMVHLVGYLDQRCGGPTGLEKGWNNELRGFDDYSALLPVYRLNHTPFCPKLRGSDVRLSVDSELQSIAEKALRKYAGAIRDRRTGRSKTKGAAVVIDVYTGEVLAAVSIPNFDPNELTPTAWSAYNGDGDGDHILINRALNGLYPPGSTFKLVTAASALENGVDLVHSCSHREHRVRWRWEGKTWSRRWITDLEEMSPHGSTDLDKAIRVSCNVYFAHLGLELGPERLFQTTQKFRLGNIPPPKKLAEDLPDSAYGQGRILVTPLEMARVVATIANGGIMMKPQYVKEVRADGKPGQPIRPSEMCSPIGPETAAKLRKMMADVVSKGTGRGVFGGLNVRVAGKTGSAENDHADGMPHSWFVGFAPVEDPRIAFAVVIENGGYGRAAAGPVCREIVRAAL